MFQWLKSFRYRGQRLGYFIIDGLFDARFRGLVKVFWFGFMHFLPFLFNLLRLVGKRLLLYFIEPVLKLIAEIFVHLIGHGRIHITALDQFFYIYLTWIRMFGNQVV